jgi:hypothetical protein
MGAGASADGGVNDIAPSSLGNANDASAADVVLFLAVEDKEKEDGAADSSLATTALASLKKTTALVHDKGAALPDFSLRPDPPSLLQGESDKKRHCLEIEWVEITTDLSQKLIIFKAGTLIPPSSAPEESGVAAAQATHALEVSILPESVATIRQLLHSMYVSDTTSPFLVEEHHADTAVQKEEMAFHHAKISPRANRRSPSGGPFSILHLDTEVVGKPVGSVCIEGWLPVTEDAGLPGKASRKPPPPEYMEAVFSRLHDPALKAKVATQLRSLDVQFINFTQLFQTNYNNIARGVSTRAKLYPQTMDVVASAKVSALAAVDRVSKMQSIAFARDKILALKSHERAKVMLKYVSDLRTMWEDVMERVIKMVRDMVTDMWTALPLSEQREAASKRFETTMTRVKQDIRSERDREEGRLAVEEKAALNAQRESFEEKLRAEKTRNNNLASELVRNSDEQWASRLAELEMERQEMEMRTQERLETKRMKRMLKFEQASQAKLKRALEATICTEALSIQCEMDKNTLSRENDEAREQMSSATEAFCAELSASTTAAAAYEHMQHRRSLVASDEDEDPVLQAEIERTKKNELAMKRLAMEDKMDQGALQTILDEEKAAQTRILERRLLARKQKHSTKVGALEASKKSAIYSVENSISSLGSSQESPMSPAAEHWVRSALHLMGAIVEHARR